jgi:transposase
VDKVRKKEHGIFLKAGEETLTGTKYLWVKNPKNFTEEEEAEFGMLRNKGLKVGRAWTIKEYFTHFWKYRYPKSARAFFKKWYFWATHSRLLPMIKVARMLKRHLDHMVTYCRFRITNAVAEGLNSKIQVIKSAARGFRNFENYRIAILFYCGKLDMLPHYSP